MVSLLFSPSRMAKSRSLFFIIILVVLVLLGLWTASAYNSLVVSRENVDAKWNNVETDYQRRFDLIPNLVSTVRGAANFEQETLTAVTNARTQWLNADAADNRGEQITAANQAESAIARLLVTVENYPELRATESFENLMVQLEGTENRISTSRKDFNQAVQSYNVQVRRFPGNVFAGMFGFGSEEGFQGAPGSAEAPTVDFDESE